MQKTLQQIKDQVAQRMGFGNWKRFEQFVKPTSAIVDEVSILYANDKLDEAKHNVSLRETNVYTTPDTDTGFSQGIEAAIETIDSLKDKI